MPGTLDIYLRQQNINKPLEDLWIPPLAVPVIVTNQSGGMGNSWYDRAPTSIVLNFVGAVAPHADTPRWSYTVPALRKAFCEAIVINLHRATAAAPAAFAKGSIQYQTAAMTVLTELLRVTSYNINVDAESQIVIGNSIMMQPGEKIEGHTVDTSGGGTVDWNVSAKITEFDA